MNFVVNQSALNAALPAGFVTLPFGPAFQGQQLNAFTRLAGSLGRTMIVDLGSHSVKANVFDTTTSRSSIADIDSFDCLGHAMTPDDPKPRLNPAGVTKSLSETFPRFRSKIDLPIPLTQPPTTHSMG